MNITPMSMYLITRLTNILLPIFVVFVFSIIGLIISIINYFANYDSHENYQERNNANLSFVKKAFIIFIITSIIACLIPTTKEMAAILIIPKIANSEIVGELPKDIKDLKSMAIQYLKEQMEDKK